MTDQPNDVRARRVEIVKRDICAEVERTLDERVERYLEVGYQGVVAGEYFAPASGECIRVYRDGYLLSAVMVSQSVTEALWRFILERNAIEPTGYRSQMVPALIERRILTREVGDAFVRIERSFRNDVHHLNPKVGSISFRQLARRNLIDLGQIEREIFGVTFDNGRMVPNQPKYWDLRPDGTTTVSLRDMWIE
jgi:hypothetical protein